LVHLPQFLYNSINVAVIKPSYRFKVPPPHIKKQPI